MAEPRDIPFRLPLRPDYQLTDGAAAQLTQLTLDAAIYVGQADSGLRANDEWIGTVESVTQDGTFVLGTARLFDTTPEEVLVGLDMGTMGFGIDAEGTAKHLEGGVVLIDGIFRLRGINVVPVDGQSATEFADER